MAHIYLVARYNEASRVHLKEEIQASEGGWLLRLNPRRTPLITWVIITTSFMLTLLMLQQTSLFLFHMTLPLYLLTPYAYYNISI